PVLNANLGGYEVALARVERLSPWGITLRDLVVRTPRGELARAGLVAVELAPSALLRQVVELPHVQVAHARVQLAALPESEPAEKPASSSSPWAVRVHALEVRALALEVQLEERALEARVQTLDARGEWGSTPHVEIVALAL